MMTTALETTIPGLRVRFATEADVTLILELIRALASFEELSHQVVANEETLRRSLFGPRPFAETLIAELEGVPVGFALFFHSFSTFLGEPGLYLEDLFVRPEARSHGIGREMMSVLARIALERGCARFEWSVLDWNARAISFYRSLGAIAMDGWTVQRVTGEQLETLARSRGR